MVNSPKLAFERNKSLRLLKPRKVRNYTSSFIDRYKHLIDGFTRAEYVEYERIFLLFGRSKPNIMLNYVQINKHAGVILEMAQLRVTDRAVHARVIDRIRHRWTSLHDHKTSSLGEDALWIRMARSVQKNSKGREDKKLYPEWEGTKGAPILADYLKNLFQAQGGKCAITGEDMTLSVDSRKRVSLEKCSVDRKYSTKGYEPNNIWLVSYWVNVMKSDMTLKQFWKKAKIISDAYHTRDIKK